MVTRAQQGGKMAIQRVVDKKLTFPCGTRRMCNSVMVHRVITILGVTIIAPGTKGIPIESVGWR